ncbi:MAG: hypothetical protein IPG22_06660 [Acidobacteria bacterium]|nr:hypothetical protein [Acidobacteriota bacterium]MBK6587981.1 hypothetical protein [Acidobacteriota bacterium]
MSDAKREAVEAVRLWNSDCPTSIKTASELASQGKRCGNCAYFSHLKMGRCALKFKRVSSFNICERHSDRK